MIGRCLVLPPRLTAVAAVAKCLPVGLVPEKGLIASMRNDVVHISSLDVAAFLQALHAQRVREKESLSGFLPRRTIAQLCRRTSVLRVKWFVPVTVLCPGGNQRGAAGMLARHFWFVGH